MIRPPRTAGARRGRMPRRFETRRNMKTTLSTDATREISARLSEANREFAVRYPGESFRRQPVHTVYGGAHLFKSDTTVRLGALARRALDAYAPNFAAFARALDLPGSGELPDSVTDDSAVRAALESDEAACAPSAPALARAQGLHARRRRSSGASRSRTSASTSRTATATAPTTEEDGHAASAAARGRAAGLRRARSRPSSASASSPSPRSCTRAASARSTSSSRRCSRRRAGVCPRTSSSRCRR